MTLVSRSEEERRTGILPVSSGLDFGDRLEASLTVAAAFASDFFAMRRVCTGNPAASILR